MSVKSLLTSSNYSVSNFFFNKDDVYNVDFKLAVIDHATNLILFISNL